MIVPRHYYVNDRKQEDPALFDLREALRDPVSVRAAFDAEFVGRDLSKGNLANLICFRCPEI